jgi:putative MATE family efflux protein
MEKSLLKNFMKYVSLNILGMVGISCYILADTYFISIALGSTGLAALNLSISVYSVIHGVGLMLGIGGASRYGILVSLEKEKRANTVFSTAIRAGILTGFIFVLLGLFGSELLAVILGADQMTLPLTKTYLKTILCFAPFFILNNILLAFVRNDHNPRLSMAAMLVGSLSNIILDYVFMFPLKMGIFGAAFATGLAPVISIAVLLLHFSKRRKHKLAFQKVGLCWPLLPDMLRLGLSALINELSSAVVLITFNLVILGLEGNRGLAAYGIVANLALVVIAVFTGLAQGAQPLISIYYGQNKTGLQKRVCRYALFTSLIIAGLIYLGVLIAGEELLAVFNHGEDPVISHLAKEGLMIYFLGFFFAGVNIVKAMYLSAAEAAGAAFIISITRGFAIIIPAVLILSNFQGMTGVWLSFVLTELLVMLLAIRMETYATF